MAVRLDCVINCVQLKELDLGNWPGSYRRLFNIVIFVFAIVHALAVKGMIHVQINNCSLFILRVLKYIFLKKASTRINKKGRGELKQKSVFFVRGGGGGARSPENKLFFKLIFKCTTRNRKTIKIHKKIIKLIFD